MKKLLISILFRLLSNPSTYAEIDEASLEKWLLWTYKDRGFREYFKKRDYQLLKAIGNGVSRDEYLILLGRRLELLSLLYTVDTTFKKDQQGTLIEKARKAEEATSAVI